MKRLERRMLAGPLTKSVLHRWGAIVITAGAIAVLLFGATAIYRDLDLSVLTDLSEVTRELFGFGGATGVAGLAFGSVYEFMGALALCGVAIWIGADAIAGEERGGTIGLLLANPLSRRRVVLSKAAGLVLLVALGGLILWAGGALGPEVLDVSLEGLEVGALVLHMSVIALFFASLAFAIGSWSGNPGTASRTATIVLMVSYLAATMLPQASALEDLAKLSPWYYYESSGPLTAGVDWGDLALLLGLSALFGAAALFGFQRRDLKERGVRISLLDRLRGAPLTAAVAERLEGSVRVSRIGTRTASEHRGVLTIAGAGVLGVAAVTGPFYSTVDQQLKDFTSGLPDAVLALIGNADYGTPEGIYTGEVFSLLVPIAVIAVTTVVGAAGLAGEERNRTMGLLLASPITRRRVVLEKATVIVVYALVVAALTAAGCAIGTLLSGLELSAAGIAGTSLLAGLLGMAFGALALALGAATGRPELAAYGTAGVAFVSYLANSLLPLSDSLADLAEISPFHYYLSSEPLSNGMDWPHGAVLAGLALVLVAISVPLFERRDLRSGS